MPLDLVDDHEEGDHQEPASESVHRKAVENPWHGAYHRAEIGNDLEDARQNAHHEGIRHADRHENHRDRHGNEADDHDLPPEIGTQHLEDIADHGKGLVSRACGHKGDGSVANAVLVEKKIDREHEDDHALADPSQARDQG